MLEGLFHHKKEEKEYLCALLVSEDRIDAALLETGKNDKGVILKIASKEYLDGWEHAINSADEAITEIEEPLPEGHELTKVVFGLFPEWLEEDRIKDSYLKKLKQLTTSLSLTPVGFVELPLAIEHRLHRDEGAQQTVILVGIESKHLTVTLFKIGKASGSITSLRSESIALDVEKALATFTDVEVLPSRVLLYGTSGELEKLKEELLNYPWQKKANFIHFPKIEILPKDFAVSAVAIASSSELTSHPEEKIETVASSSPQLVENDSPDPEEPIEVEETDEVGAIAEDLGFVKDKDAKDVALSDQGLREAENIVLVPPEVVDEEIPLPVGSLGNKPKWNFKFPQMSWAVTIKNPKLALGLAVLALLLLIGGAFWWFYWSLPKAKVTILVTPKNLNSTEAIKIDLSATAFDISQKTLPGKMVKHETKGTKTVTVSGKKTVGDKAKGEVVIYNKTLNSKTFKSGAVLSAGKLKFTLVEETSIASASESVGSLSYGTTKAKVSASDIGSASNVSAGTEFTFAELPTTLYSARNESVFMGGTSRDIKVVTRDDQKNASLALQKDLEKQAITELEQTIPPNEHFLDESLTSTDAQISFTKEIGEESDQFGVDAKIEVTGLTYNKDDFFALLDGIVKQNIPPNYSYKHEDADISVENIDKKDDVYTLSVVVKLKLYPQINTGQVPKKIAGKSITQATEILRTEPNVTGVEFGVEAPFEWLKTKLPQNPGNILIIIRSI